jgi:hypothetical protein
MSRMSRAHRWLAAGTLGLAILLGGCLGLTRGAYWTGRSTGGPGDCVPFAFEVSREGDRITGWAATRHEWGAVSWDVSGVLGEDGAVSLETRTIDPRVPRQRVSWRGTGNVFLGHLAETERDPACPEPRTVRFQRR